jgi:uncharacterized membrane protein
LPFSSWRSAALGCGIGFAIGYLLTASAIRPVTSAVAVLSAAAGLLLGFLAASVLVQVCRTVYQRPILERLDERTYDEQNGRAARTRVVITLAGGAVAWWGLPAELLLVPPVLMLTVLAAAGWYLNRVFRY